MHRQQFPLSSLPPSCPSSPLSFHPWPLPSSAGLREEELQLREEEQRQLRQKQQVLNQSLSDQSTPSTQQSPKQSLKIERSGDVV